MTLPYTQYYSIARGGVEESAEDTSRVGRRGGHTQARPSLTAGSVPQVRHHASLLQGCGPLHNLDMTHSFVSPLHEAEPADMC